MYGIIQSGWIIMSPSPSPLRERWGDIVFGADPVGVDVGVDVTLYCPHNIL